jgi:hypothetical protein
MTGCGDDDDPTGPGEFPDVRGEWIGQYSVATCTILSGTDPFFCQDLFYEGSSRFHDLRIDAQNRSRVVGTAWQGQVTGSVEGTVSELGVLTLSGRIGVDEAATTTIEEWEAALVGDSLVGGWTFTFEDNTDLGFGSARIDAEFTLIDPGVPNYRSCPVEVTLAQTDGIEARLDAGDCQLVEDESYYDVYAVAVTPDDQVEIRARSSGFDPVLFIFDLEGFEIACSAPTGTVEGCTYTNAPDSVAAVALEAVVAETWLIVVNSVAGEEIGDYTLTTQALAAASASSDLKLQRVVHSSRSGVAAKVAGPPHPAVRSKAEIIKKRFVQPISARRDLKRSADGER